MDRREVMRALALGAAAVAVGVPATVIAVRSTGDGADGEVASDTPTGSPTADRSGPTSTPDPDGAAPGADRAGPRDASDPHRGERTAAAAAQVALICREDWGARMPTGRLGEHTIHRVTVHHTAAPVGGGPWSTERLRGYQRYHQDAGFVDLAYHIVIAPDGAAYEGRALDQPGESFTDYDPAGHLHVCLDGDFTREQPSRQALATLSDVLAWGCEAFAVDPATIEGHRRYAATACPGGGLEDRLEELRRAAASRIGSGGVQLARSC